MLKRTLSIISRLTALFEEYLVAFLLILVTVLMFVQVVMRYVFAKRLLGYEELARYSMIWLAFIGAAYATRLRSHIKVDILPLIIKDERSLKKAEIIQDFLSFAFCTVFLYWLWVLLQAAGYRTPALGIPVWVPQMGIVIGFILMLCYFLAHFIKGVRDLIHAEPAKDE